MIPVHICLFKKIITFKRKIWRKISIWRQSSLTSRSKRSRRARFHFPLPACLPLFGLLDVDMTLVLCVFVERASVPAVTFSSLSASPPHVTARKRERERQHKKSHCTSSLFLFNPFSILLFVVRKILPPDITRNRTCRPWLLFYYKWRKVSYDVWGNVIQKATL